VCRTRATQKHTHTHIGRPRIVVFLLSLPFPHNFCKRKTRGRRANKTFVKTEDGKRRQRRRFTGKIEALRPPLSLRNLVSRAQVQNAGTYETGGECPKNAPQFHFIFSEGGKWQRGPQRLHVICVSGEVALQDMSQTIYYAAGRQLQQ